MLHRFGPLVVSLCAALPAHAQHTMLLDEDFESGANDWFVPGFVQMWHITPPGECGSPGAWASSSLAHIPCVYGSIGWAWNSELSSPAFVPDGGPLELSFRSRRQMDASDRLWIFLDPPSVSGLPRIEIASELSLQNGGALEDLDFNIQLGPYAGLECRLLFLVGHDGIVDQGFGWMIDDVRLAELPATRTFCVGDGSAGGCPCGNLGGPEAGCEHSGGSGARLTSTGTQIVAQDDLVLQLVDAPAGQPAVLFLGDAIIGSVPFRDGLLCAGGSTRRVERMQIGADGRASTSEPLASRTSAIPGTQHYYQVWFRDPGGTCGTGSNFSAGASVDWI